MSIFFAEAWANAEPVARPQGGGMEMFFMLGIFLVAFYFFVLRPQNKRVKEHRSMLDSLSKGDEIVTTGGIAGKIVKIGDNFIILNVAEGVELSVQKQSVSSTLPKGTLKSL
ncbi:MAG: preprotein translocase subunit YajC [Pseudomonadota bacterium]